MNHLRIEVYGLEAGGLVLFLDDHPSGEDRFRTKYEYAKEQQLLHGSVTREVDRIIQYDPIFDGIRGRM